MKEPEAMIKSISQIGEVEIFFSQQMELNDLFEGNRFEMQASPPNFDQ